jgi:serine/threonine-protein kinase
VIAALTALGVLAVVALTVGLILMNQPKQVNVPDLTGKTQDQAQAAVVAAGLGLTRGDDVERDNCAVNTVIEQEPDPNVRVREDSLVTVRFCIGPGMVTIPASLVGSQQAAAVAALETLGLRAKVTEVDNIAPKGIVVEVPDQGKAVPKDTEVELRVSRGNQKEVPNVVGRTEAEARAILEAAGFSVGKVDVDVTDPEQAGKVQSQDPKEKTIRNVGSRVVIRVGVYEEPTPTDSPTPGP